MINEDEFVRGCRVIAERAGGLAVMREWMGHAYLQMKAVRVYVREGEGGGEGGGEDDDDDVDVWEKYEDEGEEEGRELYDRDDERVMEKSGETMAMVVYDVVYSKVYHVPALYFYAIDEKSNRVLSLPEISSTFTSTSGLSIDVCSSGEHPITGQSCFFLHPCSTSLMLESFPSSDNRVMTWLSVVANIVGISKSIKHVFY
jgi:hypothetical protein